MAAHNDFDSETFFRTQAPPPYLDQRLAAISDFVQRHVDEGRRIALITSGGTTVPLEQNVYASYSPADRRTHPARSVRFLDNFSAGTRGSASAEYFLRTGRYAVIFLHRQHSLQPFSRHYSHSTNPFLDLLEIVNDAEPMPQSPSQTPLFASPTTFAAIDGAVNGATTETPLDTPHFNTAPFVRVLAKHTTPMVSLMRSYQRVQALNLLHRVDFVTVFDYLFLLRGIARTIAAVRETRSGEPVGRKALFYLAAAVSDFFVPQQKLSEHKIQSGKGSLSIEMDGVPKVLRTLVDDWASGAFIVSFKLETDMELLIPKARGALQKYRHSLVIANELHRRKTEVVFVQAESEEVVRISPSSVASGSEIEEEIVNRLSSLHDAYVQSGKHEPDIG